MDFIMLCSCRVFVHAGSAACPSKRASCRAANTFQTRARLAAGSQCERISAFLPHVAHCVGVCQLQDRAPSRNIAAQPSSNVACCWRALFVGPTRCSWSDCTLRCRMKDILFALRCLFDSCCCTSCLFAWIFRSAHVGACSGEVALVDVCCGSGFVP